MLGRQRRVCQQSDADALGRESRRRTDDQHAEERIAPGRQSPLHWKQQREVVHSWKCVKRGMGSLRAASSRKAGRLCSLSRSLNRVLWVPSASIGLCIELRSPLSFSIRPPGNVSFEDQNQDAPGLQTSAIDAAANLESLTTLACTLSWKLLKRSATSFATGPPMEPAG